MITAILIDDEANSRNALYKKLQLHCPLVTVLASCNNAEEGIKAIEEFKPNVIFLDIEMPRMNGFAMLEKIDKKDFNIVFTTAYNQYAINAIKFGAFDYLVKPVDVDELVTVVKKLEEKNIELNNADRLTILLNQLIPSHKKEVNKIAIATQMGLELVPVESIVYLEAIGNYTQLHFKEGKPLLASKTLKDFEELLVSNSFFRIHNASLINLIFVKKYIKGDGGQVQLINDIILDVARRRKDELVEKLIEIAPKV